MALQRILAVSGHRERLLKLVTSILNDAIPRYVKFSRLRPQQSKRCPDKKDLLAELSIRIP